jgi:CRP/FNR family transcriptional regulator, cyclic AMP receptor protein
MVGMHSNGEKIARFLETYAPSQPIFRRGDAGHAMYVVQDGEVEIRQEHGETVTRLALLGKGEIFGEMALVDSSPRSASAVAGPGGATVLAIDQAHFVYLVSQQPAFALVVLHTIANRLRSQVDRQEVAV